MSLALPQTHVRQTGSSGPDPLPEHSHPTAAIPRFYVQTSDKSGQRLPVVGSGVHTYECVHDWLTPPDGLVWGDTHGLAQDEQGRIYVAHTVSSRP